MSEEQRALVSQRTALFPALAVGFGLLMLALLEAGLRVVGFGDDHPLFVDSAHLSGKRHANPDVIQRYFPEAPALHIDAIPFDREKEPDGLRIVVQGGSTAAGFPYGRWAGLAGMLGDRLETSFPERQVEVISTAMAGVSSYVLLDFVDEILAVEPDAILIYAGHNEYLGIMGAGSAMTPSRLRGATVLQLKLRGLRLYQFVRWWVSLGSAVFGDGASAGSPLMSRAAAAQPIPRGSVTRRRGRLQFERNLERILQLYQRAGVAVYLGTLASNERDLPPFAGGASAGSKGTRDDSADAWYAVGRREREAGNIAAARAAYRNARDRDQLPFRAPSAFNEVIRRLAERFDANLVDVEVALAGASADGIIGHEVMLEHVHPNAEGYFLLADAYFEMLRAQGAIGDGPHLPTRAQAAADMPITAIDRLLAKHAVRELEAAYPFTEATRAVEFPRPTNAIERLAARYQAGEIDWLDAMEGLLQLYRRGGRTREAIVVARMAAQAYPSEAAPNFSVGMLYLEAGLPRRARRYLERSLAASPDDAPTRRALRRVEAQLRSKGIPSNDLRTPRPRF